ncbi:MAG: DUF262 domain-containing protein [Rikenellaceae bacterium]|nr:DUF262 domain-containing protein [Rikenellaceae bacterium]
MINNTNTKAMSFWKFLNDNTIEIPIIQRDYAHGRLGKETLRKNFLADLKKALDNESPYKDTSMKLDFVYGSKENGRLNPLDGQQRLTTLWLLHWYIALRAGQLNEDNCSIFRKFTYETRISSREFCENLCVPVHFLNYNKKDIVGFITKQTWFYSAWKQDPTIQSMLRMLGGTKVANKKGEDIIDGIEELFQNTNEDVFKNYWDSLTEKDAIVFYHLPLSDFGLSDDLYIKMNARGKQLTGFENFKADLIGYITKQAQDETIEHSIRTEWEKLLDPKNGIPIKLDTDWTDIFWECRSKDNRIDEIFFTFLNRFFWNELFIATKPGDQESYVLDIGKGDESSTKENNNSSYKYLNNSDHPSDFDTTIAYEGLDIYRYYEGSIPLPFFQKLSKILTGYHDYSANNIMPICLWDNTFSFIPLYDEKNSNNIEIANNANERILKVTTLNQVQRVVFFAICKYFNDSGVGNDDELSLKQWMRVVWNLVSGEDHNGHPQIRSAQAMRTAMKFIGELNSHAVYDSLSKYNIKTLGNSDFDERCKEEINKAKQILDENGILRKYNGSCKKQDGTDYQTWEDIIIDAENYAFFKGSIRFLFVNDEETDEVEKFINWGDFDFKWANVRKYFDQEGIKPVYKKKALLLRALLSRIDIGENWFGYYKGFWYISLLNKNYRRAIHYLLTANQLAVNEQCNENWIKDSSLLHTLLESKDSWHILTDWKGYSVLTGYSYRWSGATSFKEIVVLNYLRNSLLNSLNDIVISDDNKVDGTNYFYGWEISFTYKGKEFKWCEDNKVYLSTNDINAHIDDQLNPDDCYYFDASSINMKEEFVNALNGLLSRLF